MLSSLYVASLPRPSPYSANNIYPGVHILPPRQPCPHCFAMRWPQEPDSICCASGNKCIPKTIISPFTASLFLQNSTRIHARRLNNSFSFSSSVFKDESVQGGGIAALRLSGELNHLVHTGHNTAFAGIYMHDAIEQRRLRDANNGSTKTQAALQLEHYIIANNPYARGLHSTANAQASDICIQIHENTGSMGRFQAPKNDKEIAALIPNNTVFFRPSFRHTENSNTRLLRSVSYKNCARDPLRYPLFYPEAQPLGWHLGYASKQLPKRKRITIREFYAQRILEESHIVLGGRLFQEYVLDVWTRVEESQLNWLRFNQHKLRTDTWSNVRSALQSGTSPEDMGKKKVFPASFTCGPRFYRRVYTWTAWQS